ncbi:WXG100 family type VII secretion target [Streptomyces sp. AK02-01A]|uniref:WXG100 family type VII secretion target n=1 Tax=Streptomyces sp. AK02-01A TaxID=3028648 RepID=UPI0029B31289|nr:WXG100 family type VII secretion target [Streptomyces sp. AK02-01A]MDX3849469.1 WXG100 family type VII secretion target [Streptomyces sp. AK02-01A]
MSPVRTVADDGAYQVAAQAIESTISQCDQIRNNATNAYETLVSAWQGGAGQAFGQALTSWNDKYNQLRQMMDTFADTLAGTRGHMSGQENTAHQNAQRFNSMVNGQG